MTAISIDTYALITKLKDSGIAVTNKDLDARIKETELKIELVKSELRSDIAEIKADLVRWVVGVGLLQITMITGLIMKLAGRF